MSDTPGPRAMSPSTRNGRSAAVPSSKTVSMCPTSKTFGPPVPRSRADQEIAEPRIAVVRASLDLPAVVFEPALAHVGDPVHALRRVRTAVDVDHGLERFEELGVARRGCGREAL